jgi:4-hydroxybenzoate polyprenyltransferase
MHAESQAVDIAAPPLTRAGLPRLLARLLRIGQWPKNMFVFAGVMFGSQYADGHLALATCRVFVAFCLASSAVYILNDYHDRDADRRHPIKRLRPLASGEIAPARALAIAGGLLALALACAGTAAARAQGLLLAYLAVNVAYSWHLKRVVVIDVMCIASGFMLRLLAGTWAIGIPPSGWLLVTGMFLTLFIAFAKRRAEWAIQGGQGETRAVLLDYTEGLLDTYLAITAAGTAICYALYTVDPQTISLHRTDRLVATVPVVVFWLLRYLFLLHRGRGGGDPSADVFADRQLLFAALLFGATVLAILQPYRHWLPN